MAIRTTPSGKYQVDIKIGDRPRFRKSYSTYQLAQEAERAYQGGAEPVKEVTIDTTFTVERMYNLACESVWPDKRQPSRLNAHRDMMLYWGAGRDVTTITTADITDWKKWMMETRERTRATGNRYLSAYSVMFKLAVENGHITTMPFMRLFPKAKNRREFVLSYDQEEALLTYLHKEQGAVWHALGVFLCETGARTSEALNLRWDNVYLDQGYAVLYGTKRDKTRQAPLTERVVSVLAHLKEGAHPNGRLFPISQWQINKTVWPKVREALGIDNPDFVPHSLRHTRATRLVESGVPLDVVQQWMGHGAVATTMNYVHFDAGRFKAAKDMATAHRPENRT
jgi:integrase